MVINRRSCGIDNELHRLANLHSFNLDTASSPELDQLTQLAAKIFDAPIALISLVDESRQFFKSRVGLDICETPRDISFCTHTIAMPDDKPLIIHDVSVHPTFVNNPLVTGPPFIRSYFGCPLVSREGFKIGTLCIIDTKARPDFDDKDAAMLQNMASVVADKLELWRLSHLNGVNHSRWKNIAATSPDAIICTNLKGLIEFWNGSAEALFGYAEHEILHTSVSQLTDQSGEALYASKKAMLESGQSSFDSNLQITAKRKDGTTFPAELSFSTWAEGDSHSIGLIIRDITERKKNYAQLKRLALTDVLTGLANRSNWKRVTQQALASNQPVTVLLADLDGFKEVNDTLGHAAGDEILKIVGRILQRCCHIALSIARLGGDEFAILLPPMSQSEAEMVAQTIIAEIAVPHELYGQQVFIGTSIGIAVSPAHGSSAEELLRSADLALYKAKDAGKNRYELYQPELRAAIDSLHRLKQELREAIRLEQFVVHYQPQYDLHSGELVGAEALLRWQHPERGLLSPDQFIDALNKKSANWELGIWILGEACIQAAKWQQHCPGLRVGVNLFDSQLRSNRFPALVAETLKITGLAPELLELELVETTFLLNDTNTINRLNSLRALGVKLAFDDYGTGFAALNLLKSYPVNRLKIDKSFVQDIERNKGNASLVKAIIYLAKSFELEVIAEGVEDKAQINFLRQFGCDEVQGFYYGKPVTAAQFEAMFFS